MIELLFNNPLAFFLVFGSVLLSLTFHEFAHAFIADKLGDPTPRSQGRVTLDPRAHLDPLGTIALLLTHFGWGKPVEIDPFNLKNPVRDSALIALAGPASNLLIAGLLTVLFHTLSMPEILMSIIKNLAIINIFLAVFNLVPVHPLDGSRVVLVILPRTLALEYQQFMDRYGLFVLLGLLIPWYNGSSPITTLISPIIDFLTRTLFG